MTRRCVGLGSLALAVFAARASAEYAILTFETSGSISWIDKAGGRVGASTTRADVPLFGELSGAPAERAHAPERDVLVLNGLAAQGWNVVGATARSNDAMRYVLRRDDATTRPTAAAGAAKAVDVAISGGHETDPRDGGRPVALVAGAPGVPPDVFRDAFAHVAPARGNDGGPTPQQARVNKQALISRLSPLGVTNDRLDAVSNSTAIAATPARRGRKPWRNRRRKSSTVASSRSPCSTLAQGTRRRRRSRSRACPASR